MKASTLEDYKRRMLKVLVEIQQRLDGDLRLPELARIACFSPYHFHHIFSGMMGESLKEHVRRLRLERAAIQLKLTRKPIIQIALDAGYETHESFTRAFKAAYGLAPREFRLKKSPALTVPSCSGVHFGNAQSMKNFKARPGSRKTHVKILRRDPVSVAFIRHVGPYNKVASAWDKLLPFLGKGGWLGGDSEFIGICHDDPEVTLARKIRYDACVTIDPTFKPRGEIGSQTIAGGDYAMATHIGPYERLGETYAAVFGQWLPRSGRGLRASPCFEVYLNDPGSTEPEELITDIYVPLY